MFLSHITDKIRHDLGNGQRYLHNATEPIRETFVDIPVETVKAANRGTPWGQANQRNFNAANVPYVPLAANALHVQPQNTRGVGQTFNDSSYMPIMQGSNYGAMQGMSTMAPSPQMQPQQYYNQQQLHQHGVKGLYMPGPTVPKQKTVDWSAYYQEPLQQIY